MPTLKEVLEGYERFNVWEADEKARTLPQMPIKESVTQFFQLCLLAQSLNPDAGARFLQQDKAHWLDLLRKRRQIAKRTAYASAASGITRSTDDS
jgi:hypothetical protein